MRTSPAPTYATVFYGVFELFLPEKFGNSLLLYILFIDNVMVLWKKYDEEHNAADLRELRENMQELYGLEWNSQGPFLKLDSTDLTIPIKENIIKTTFFEKQINLYLYILPHSAHPPGDFNGIIYNQIHHTTNICYEQEYQKSLICQFYIRLINQGYNRQIVLTFFEKSIVHYKKKALIPAPPPTQQLEDQRKTQQLLFHFGNNP